jgi:hypothetical protein
MSAPIHGFVSHRACKRIEASSAIVDTTDPADINTPPNANIHTNPIVYTIIRPDNVSTATFPLFGQYHKFKGEGR